MPLQSAEAGGLSFERHLVSLWAPPRGLSSPLSHKRHSPSIFAQLRSNWMQMSDRGMQKIQDWIPRPPSSGGE
ncbi:MAG: hypothetical protein ORN98_06615 [Alphaproteobacteria bacterium]|nr:hypothetical protein [Alphaproteobacteria bacterium]